MRARQAKQCIEPGERRREPRIVISSFRGRPNSAEITTGAAFPHALLVSNRRILAQETSPTGWYRRLVLRISFRGCCIWLVNDYAIARLIATCVLEQSKHYARKTWRPPSARCYASSPSNMPLNISHGTRPLIDTICESPAISVREKKVPKSGYIFTDRAPTFAVGMAQWLRPPFPICLPYEGTVPLRRL